MRKHQLYGLFITTGVIAFLAFFSSCEEGPSFREFNYPAPIVNDFNPKQGYIGSDVTIEGADFGEVVGAVKVYFGGIQADSVRSVVNNKIVVQAPPNGMNGVLTVEIFGKQDTTKQAFTYLPSAQWIAISADKALEGDEVTIMGVNFGTDISKVQVFIGSKPAEVIAVTPTEVKFIVPDCPSGVVYLVVDGQRLAGSYLMVGMEKITGKLIGHAGSWNNDPTTTIAAGVDGNMDTYIDAPSGVKGYVGYDLGEGKGAVVRTVRYAPRSTHAARMDGGEIRGSDDPTRTEYVVLHTIEGTPPAGVYSEVAIDTKEVAYRYIYYTNPKNANCNLAEIEFYGNIVDLPKPVGLHMWHFDTDGDNEGWEPQGAPYVVEGGKIKATFPQTSGNKRADLRYTRTPVTIHTGKYPIVAMKFTKPTDVRITFDTNMKEVGGGYNKFNSDYAAHDVYYWDMSVLTLGGATYPDDELTFTTFQFKIADIPGTDPATGYEVDWIRTFANVDALKNFIGIE